MTPEQFCYWLRGFSELNPEGATPSPEQWRVIENHLTLVFKKETPDLRIPTPSILKWPDSPVPNFGDIRPGDFPPGPTITC